MPQPTHQTCTTFIKLLPPPSAPFMLAAPTKKKLPSLSCKPCHATTINSRPMPQPTHQNCTTFIKLLPPPPTSSKATTINSSSPLPCTCSLPPSPTEHTLTPHNPPHTCATLYIEYCLNSLPPCHLSHSLSLTLPFLRPPPA